MVLVCGNTPQLANWDPHTAPRLHYVRYGWWEVELDIVRCEGVEYKYVKCVESQREGPYYVWEGTPNRALVQDDVRVGGVVVDVWNYLAPQHKEEQDGASQTSATVMTYNIRLDTSEDGNNRWQYRKDGVAKLVRTREPAVVGFQEVLYNQLQDLQNALCDVYSWEGRARDDGDKAGEFSPIFYKKDEYKRLDGGTFWISQTPDQVGSSSWNSACRRICTWVKLSANDDGSIFFVFNTHLDHESALAREKGLELLYCRIEAISHGYPAVLCGDFNVNENERLIKQITNPNDPSVFPVCMVNSKEESSASPRGPVHTFTGWTPNGIFTIDYVLVKPNMFVQSYEVLDDKGEAGRLLSDHRPVLVEFII